MNVNTQQIIYAQTYIDKSNWPDGPWKLEPDKMLWIDEETGFECLIRRIEFISHLCGYVGITKDHPLYEIPLLEYMRNSLLEDYFKVHGNITMTTLGSSFDKEPGPYNKIGRVPMPNMTSPDQIWWIGIDFMQEEDIIPKVSNDPNENNGERVYRDIGYVMNEVNKLSKLLYKFKEEFGSLSFLSEKK